MDRLSNQTKHLMKLTQELLVSASILIFGGKKVSVQMLGDNYWGKFAHSCWVFLGFSPTKLL